MSEQLIDVIVAHPFDGYAPAERVSLTVDEANRRVDAGMARYATKADAKDAGGDPEQAATAKPKS